MEKRFCGSGKMRDRWEKINSVASDIRTQAASSLVADDRNGRKKSTKSL